jgi:hypothetical protein
MAEEAEHNCHTDSERKRNAEGCCISTSRPKMLQKDMASGHSTINHQRDEASIPGVVQPNKTNAVILF